MKSLLITILLFFSVSAIAQEITISGTIHRSMLEGGCWYLKGDGGKSYELIGDSGIMKSLRVDGQHVAVRGVSAAGTASICMMGEIVRVLQRIDTVRYPIDLPISNLTLTGKIYRTKSGVWYVKTSSGKRYEFKNPPEKKYRHSGMSIHQKFRVVIDRKSTRENMDGVITYVFSNPGPIAKQKTYDPR
jgi:hypothetical protein